MEHFVTILHGPKTDCFKAVDVLGSCNTSCDIRMHVDRWQELNKWYEEHVQ